MSKVQQAIYLATVRLHVLNNSLGDGGREHWINDDAFIEPILRYHAKRFTPEMVADALLDAYHAVVREAGEN